MPRTVIGEKVAKLADEVVQRGHQSVQNAVTKNYPRDNPRSWIITCIVGIGPLIISDTCTPRTSLVNGWLHVGPASQEAAYDHASPNFHQFPAVLVQIPSCPHRGTICLQLREHIEFMVHVEVLS